MSSKDFFDIEHDENEDLFSQDFFNELFARYADGNSDEPIYLSRNPQGGYSQVMAPDHQEDEFIPLGVEASEEDGSEDDLPDEEQETVGKRQIPEEEPVGKRQISVGEPVGKRQLPAEKENEPQGRRVISGEETASRSDADTSGEEAEAPEEKPKNTSVADTLKRGLLAVLAVIIGLFFRLKKKIRKLIGGKNKKKRPSGQSKPRPAGEGAAAANSQSRPTANEQNRPRKPLTPEQKEARRKKRLRQRRIDQAKLVGIALVFVLLIVLLVRGCTKDKDTGGTPSESSAPAASSNVTASATIAVVGDIMTHASQISDAYDAATDTYDFSYCLENVAEDLKSADFTIGNLETVMAGGTPAGHPLFNSPDALAADLAELGFDLVTTANNHCLDQTFEGLSSTLDKLDAAGIGHVGTYRSQEEFDANKGVFYTEINGIKVAFVNYTFSVNGNLFLYDYSVNLFNTDFEGAMETLDTDRIKEEMAYARSLNPDMIIACMHWGVEYKTEPNSYQKYIADYMIAQGADVVLGGHPHVPEPMEYRTTVDEEGNEVTGLVVYSLGNFISGQTPEVCGPYTQDTAILNLEIQKASDGTVSVSDVSYTPLYFLNRGSDADVQYRMYKINDAIEAYEAGEADEYVTEEVYETMKQSKLDLANILGTQWTVK